VSRLHISLRGIDDGFLALQGSIDCKDSRGGDRRRGKLTIGQEIEDDLQPAGIRPTLVEERTKLVAGSHGVPQAPTFDKTIFSASDIDHAER